MMVLAATALDSTPAPAAAPMTIQSAQRELLGLVAPTYQTFDGKVPKDVFAKQTLSFATACSMTITRRAPAHRYGGRDFAAQTEVIEAYFFEQGYDIRADYPNNVNIAALSRTGRAGRAVVAKSAAAAQRIKEVFEWLGANCKSQGNRSDHRVIDGHMTCTLRGMPNFQIHDGGRVAFSHYIRPSTGGYDALLMTGFTTNSDPRQLNVGAYTVASYFSIPKRSVPQGAATYVFYVDSRELTFPLKIVDSGEARTVSASGWASLLPLVRALAKGKQLTIRAFNSGTSQVGVWTFDLSAMRTLEATVKSTVRRC